MRLWQTLAVCSFCTFPLISAELSPAEKLCAENEYNAADLCKQYFEAQKIAGRRGPKVVESTPQSLLEKKLISEDFSDAFSPEKKKPKSGYYFKTALAENKGKTPVMGIIAWPAEYGKTGNKVIMYGPNGGKSLFLKDLGPECSKNVAEMELLKPDKSWKEISNIGQIQPPLGIDKKIEQIMFLPGMSEGEIELVQVEMKKGDFKQAKIQAKGAVAWFDRAKAYANEICGLPEASKDDKKKIDDVLEKLDKKRLELQKMVTQIETKLGEK